MPIYALDPAGETRHGAARLAPRLDGLNGRRIGLLKNGTGRSLDTARIQELLESTFPDSVVVVVDKPNRSRSVPDELFDQLRSCAAAISVTAE